MSSAERDGMRGPGPVARLRRATSASRPGVRPLAVSALIGSTGSGAFLTGAALFFTRVVGLTAAQAGFALSLSTLVGLGTMMPVGRLSDRYGPIPTFMVLNLLRGIGYLSYLLVHGFGPFLIAASLLAVVDRAAPPVNQAVAGQVFAGVERTRALALIQSVRNIGYSLGVGLAGLAVAIGTPDALRALVAANGMSFLLTVPLQARLRRLVAPASGDAGRASARPRELRRTPWRTPSYVAIMASNTVLLLNMVVTSLLLPLWIVGETHTPRWTVAVCLGANMVITAIGQIGVAARVTRYAAAAKGLRWAGVLLLAGCVLMAVASRGTNTAVTVAVLLAGVAAVSLAEMVQTAASWTVTFGICGDEDQGASLAFFGLGMTAKDVLGPMLLLGLVLRAGIPGWLALGACFTVAGVVAEAASIRAGKSVRRPSDAEHEAAPAT
ncbi:MFS transporter [Streptomyces sp. NPDC007205]|uniref:MFS transporter n=1 Tax=Streptomyces sp. NPDC007205 TaxID=3154316 RepID=UPI0033F5F7E0